MTELLQPYDRTVHAKYFAFTWSYYNGEPNTVDGKGNTGRSAWFHHWERSLAERHCDNCGARVDPVDPCWVSGSTGFVLCDVCPLKDGVTLLQAGSFRETFTPDP